MGKMPLGSQEGGGRRHRSAAECRVKLQQLVVRKGQEEALEKDDGFAEAGVEVVVGGIKQAPFAFGLQGRRVVQLFRGVGEALAEIFDEFQECGDLMEKLRTLAQKNATADSIKAGGTAALGLLKIFGIERAEIRNDAKMLRMNKHGTEKSEERLGEPLAKSWSNGEGLISFAEPAVTAKSEGFIQIDTEHSVGRFKTVQRVQVRSGFLRGERRSPILRDRTGAGGR